MEKIPEKKDRRVGKTQKCIRDAMINLIEEKEVSQITIKELAERADINRKTFYTHYSSIEDFFDKIENEVIDKLLLILDKHDFFQEQFDGLAFFTSLNDVITEDFDFYQKLIGANYNNFLFIKVKPILKAAIVDRFYKKLKINKELLSLYAEFAASGIMSMYVEWFSMNRSLSLEELAKAANNIAFNGINSIITS